MRRLESPPMKFLPSLDLSFSEPFRKPSSVQNYPTTLSAVLRRKGALWPEALPVAASAGMPWTGQGGAGLEQQLLASASAS